MKAGRPSQRYEASSIIVKRVVTFPARTVSQVKLTVNKVYYGGYNGGERHGGWKTDAASLANPKWHWYGPAVVSEIAVYAPGKVTSTPKATDGGAGPLTGASKPERPHERASAGNPDAVHPTAAGQPQTLPLKADEADGHDHQEAHEGAARLRLRAARPGSAGDERCPDSATPDSIRLEGHQPRAFARWAVFTARRPAHPGSAQPPRGRTTHGVTPLGCQRGSRDSRPLSPVSGFLVGCVTRVCDVPCPGAQPSSGPRSLACRLTRSATRSR